jgi:hypothetical protein
MLAWNQALYFGDILFFLFYDAPPSYTQPDAYTQHKQTQQKPTHVTEEVANCFPLCPKEITESTISKDPDSFS